MINNNTNTNTNTNDLGSMNNSFCIFDPGISLCVDTDSEDHGRFTGTGYKQHSTVTRGQYARSIKEKISYNDARGTF